MEQAQAFCSERYTSLVEQAGVGLSDILPVPEHGYGFQTPAASYDAS